MNREALVARLREEATHDLHHETIQLLTEAAEALAEQPAQQEPVAYMGTDIEGSPNKFRLNPFGGCVPLYKKPQSVKVWDAEGYGALCQELEGWKAKAQRKPLTDEQLYKVFPAIATYTEANKTLYRSIARAIEAAHGITKGNT